jgi:hypothetical protein
MWESIQAGLAKRIFLDDGTVAIAVLRSAPGGERAVFFSDVPDMSMLEFESEKLGSLSDLIDVLQPADIIEICCHLKKNSKQE